MICHWLYVEGLFYIMSTKYDNNPLRLSSFRKYSVAVTKDRDFRVLNKPKNNILIGGTAADRMRNILAGNVYDKETKSYVKNDALEDNYVKYRKYVTNLGIDNDTIPNVMHRLFNMKTIDYLPIPTKDKPVKICLWIGSNDIVNYSEDVVYDAIMYLLNVIRDEYKRVSKDVLPEFIIVGLLPTLNKSDTVSIFELNKSIRALNSMLADMVEKQNFTFVDLYNEFYDAKRNRVLTKYFDGFSNLNYEGYKIVNSYLEPLLLPTEST